MISLFITVSGLSEELLESFLITKLTDDKLTPQTTAVTLSSSDLCFGLVGLPLAMGAWGRSWPVILQRGVRGTPASPGVLKSGGAAFEAAAAPPILPRALEGDPLVCGDDPLLYTGCVTMSHGSFSNALKRQERRVAPFDVSHCTSTGQTAEWVMECRLVIVDRAAMMADGSPWHSCTPGKVLVGVDCLYSMPSQLILTPASAFEGGATPSPHGGAEVSAQWIGRLSFSTDPPLNQTCRERRTMSGLSIVPTREQFVQLHNLPDFPPRSGPGSAAEADEADMEVAWRDSFDASVDAPGPLLSLTLYANDPTKPYDQVQWLADLPCGVRACIPHSPPLVDSSMPATHRDVDRTTLFQVTDVQPVPVEGSCWCRPKLPKPAPLDRRPCQRPTSASPPRPLSQRSTASGLSIAASDSSHEGRSNSSSRHRDFSRTSSSAPLAAKQRTWCVRPLTMVPPLRPHQPLPTRCVDVARSQHTWTTLLNLRELEDFAVEVRIRMTLQVDGVAVTLHGSTVLFSDMLQSSTSGTVLLPVLCPAADGGGGRVVGPMWVKLYVQYLVVFPLREASQRPLEVVRSTETTQRLTVATLVGHRGLGKTFTRMWSRPWLNKAIRPWVSPNPSINVVSMKLDENTIPAFNAAHARGSEMVEFDVMLSADRIPVIIHDPFIDIMALKRTTIRDAAAAGIEQPCGTQGVAHGEDGIHDYAPVRMAVHMLSWPQLRDLCGRCCTGFGRATRLRDVLAHHWERLMLWVQRGDGQIPSGAGVESQEGVRTPSRPSGRSAKERGSAMSRLVDLPDGIPTLRDLFLLTPSTLRLNIEVKYPFQPRYDANLFLQSDAFEVNGFVDAILRVVFEMAGEERDITFSSFDPNLCLALAWKQSRYPVLFLSDTQELRDLKDYRSFYIEGAVQFAASQYLSGICINARTLLSDAEAEALGSSPVPEVRGSAAKGPVVADFFNSEELLDTPASPKFGHSGAMLVEEVHRRGLKLWTWGEVNGDLYCAYMEACRMKVDAVISDRIPVFAS